MYLEEIGCGFGDWIGVTQDKTKWRAFVKALMNFCVP
jgi:hypothetical protein